MVDYSGMPAMRGFFAPQRFEADVFDCEVEGTIPPGLNGAFVRVGSDWNYPPKHADDAPFNQDGYISMFRLKDGRASYKGRWVKTPRFLNCHKAGRQLYGYYRNPFDNEPGFQNIDKPWLNTVMNTAVLAHAGKLLVLKEDSQPYAVDPVTLETQGLWDFHGGYKSQTFTAHPKIDPRNGDLLTYGFEATGLASDDLFYYVIDARGRVKHEVRLKVPYVSMIHDWAVTESHVVFPVFPYCTSMEQLRAGQTHWKWDGARPTYIGIMPRYGSARDIRWFKGPARAIVHTFNARTVGDKVILEAPTFEGNPFPFFPAQDGAKWDPAKGRAMIRRMTFDLASQDDTYAEEIIVPGLPVVDLARIDDRYAGRDNRYGFAPFRDESKPFDAARAGQAGARITNSYGMFDLKDGTWRSFFAGPVHSLQEPEFIPRAPDAPESDGWLIGVANNYAENRSEMIIADTRDLAAGAVARIILPFRSNVQVHGRWFGDHQLGLGDAR